MAGKNTSRKGSLNPRTEEAVAVPSAPAAASVDQIRDIIFGSQMQEYEKRFAALEKRLLDETAALRDDVVRRMEEIASDLDARLKKEGEVRAKSAKELASRVTAVARDLEKRAAKIEGRAATDLQATQEETRRESEARQAELAVVHQETLALIDTRSSALEENKADRAVISNLLRDFAAKLSNEQPSRSVKATRRKPSA